MSKICATVVADSISNGHRITTMKVVMPRIVLAEFNTHRMLSKNSASSRAIPFDKMVEMVKLDPFIPIAWQADHKGMQGTEYLEHMTADIEDVWLRARDEAIDAAEELTQRGVTKQLCNRLLEPFMYHTVLCTATELENFFHLRCPKYYYEPENKYFRSRQDWMNYFASCFGDDSARVLSLTELDWLKLNKGQAEIHMMAVAEAMYDARNESEPKILQPGEWHIPYQETFIQREGFEDLKDIIAEVMTHVTGFPKVHYLVPFATAVCAQVSYTTVGIDKGVSPQEVLLDLHNSLLVRPYTNRKGVVFGPDDPIHTSPAEHCAQAMTDDEFQNHVKGIGVDPTSDAGFATDNLNFPNEAHGWCHNLRGWKSYRSMIPNENRR